MSNGESRESLDLLASAAEQSSPQSRIKRNTACVSCRDSKVREIAPWRVLESSFGCGPVHNLPGHDHGADHGSQVKCNASTVPGQPCQRCQKLKLRCVVDKSHKRVSKRRWVDPAAFRSTLPQQQHMFDRVCLPPNLFEIHLPLFEKLPNLY